VDLFENDGVSHKAPRVTAVVCAAFDEATDEAVLIVREVVRGAGVSLPPVPPHRPHFSLAAAVVSKDELPAVAAVATEVARRHAPIPLQLRDVGRFGRAGALWLGPTPNAALTALHQDVHASLLAHWPSAFGERSEPSQWVAHCTLATRVPRPQLREVQQQVVACFRPIDGTLDAIATILVGGRGDVSLAALTCADP
jgi:2'-5' RNA ligase